MIYVGNKEPKYLNLSAIGLAALEILRLNHHLPSEIYFLKECPKELGGDDLDGLKFAMSPIEILEPVNSVDEDQQLLTFIRRVVRPMVDTIAQHIMLHKPEHSVTVQLFSPPKFYKLKGGDSMSYTYDGRFHIMVVQEPNGPQFFIICSYIWS